MYYQKHIFFCNNVKCEGKKCCALGDPTAKRAYAKAKLKKLGVPKGESGVRISLSSCMGRCDEGPLLVIYPDGVWYRYHSDEDIDKILTEHVKGGRIVEELVV